MANFQHDTFFPSQDIKQNMLLSSYLDIWWHHKLKDLSWIKLSNNGWQGEKEEKVEIQKFEYLKNEKSFFDEIKDIFHSFWRPFIWWRIKISQKIVDTRFQEQVKLFFSFLTRFTLIKVWEILWEPYHEHTEQLEKCCK